MNLIAPAHQTRIAFGYHYSAKPLLSPSEARMYECLEKLTAGRCHILCKPRLADVMTNHDGIVGLNKISQKHVDFLFCRKDDWMPMLALELDDLSHEKADRKKRDMFVNSLFASVGIPLIRINVSEMTAVEMLVKKLFQAWESRIQTLELGGGRKPKHELGGADYRTVEMLKRKKTTPVGE